MTGVMLVGTAKSALPIGMCNESIMTSVEIETSRRRRPRVKSVESVERAHRCQPLGLPCNAPFCNYNNSQSRTVTSQSVDFGREGYKYDTNKYQRTRGSTELSEFEEFEQDASLSVDVHKYSEDGKLESGSEYDSEAVDTFEELNSIGSGGLPPLQSKAEFNFGRFAFPRKSSYISRNNRPAAGGLAKLLRQSDLGSEAKVDVQDALFEENTDVGEEERHFGFRKCTHCFQIYACERGGEDEEDARVPEDCKRSKYCSGECHLTHLSSLYEKQRRR